MIVVSSVICNGNCFSNTLPEIPFNAKMSQTCVNILTKGPPYSRIQDAFVNWTLLKVEKLNL